MVFSKEVDQELKKVCLEIARRYSIYFVEIGTDQDHVHFLIQSVPLYSPKKIAQIVKSITAREILKNRPEVKQMLWGGEFWTDGYYISSVGRNGNETTVTNYVKNQGKEYKYTQLHKDQLRFDI